MEIRTSGDQITEQMMQTNNASSIIDSIPLTIQEPAASTHLSIPTQGSSMVLTSSSTEVIYMEPKIVVQPKPDWKSRYPKDLIVKPKKEAQNKPKCTRKQSNKKENTPFIGLLQGAGSQRSRIQIKVIRSLY